MALYRVHFVDHVGNVYATKHADHHSDDAIRAAQALDIPSIGAGPLICGTTNASFTDTGTDRHRYSCGCPHHRALFPAANRLQSMPG